MQRWRWSALGLSLALVGILGWLGFGEARPQWQAYQRLYAERAGTGPAEAWLGIQQFELPALGRVDRCTTCHLGVTDANMAGAPEPFREHSRLLQSHPPARYGCTVCHGGEGRAVTLAEAHGQAPGQQSQLLPPALMQSACYGCHAAGGPPTVEADTVAEGIKLANQLACIRCHQFGGAGGSVGPDLSTIASQRGWVELYAHLLDPSATVPGSTMPDFGLSREQATALTAFLLTQRAPRERVRDVDYLAMAQPPDSSAEGSATAASATAPSPPPLLAAAYSGAVLFDGLQCRTCHQVGLRGGEVGPALTHIGRARSAEWLRTLLEDPAGAFPRGQMPRYDLTASQVDALVDYLSGLK
jgi:cbb3-type cytochrome oxidase cytochrome c subunit